MTFGKGIGCNVKTKTGLSMDKVLFSETGGFVVEVLSKNIDSVKLLFANYGLEVFNLGNTDNELILINDIIKISVDKTKKAWLGGLRNKL